MKDYALTLVLALSVVAAPSSLRRSLDLMGGSPTPAPSKLLRIGGSPTPHPPPHPPKH